MRMAYRLVAVLLLIGLAQYLTGGWGVWLALAAVAAWLSMPVIRRVSGRGSSRGLLGAAQGTASGKPDPPTDADYRAAGVDMRACGKCRKPLKSMGYFFGLDGVPTVYCPSCWSKASSPMNDEKFDDWFDRRLTTKYDRRHL